MRGKTASALAAILVLALSGDVLADVEWHDTSWESALERARTENKHVFVDFYATWCGPCKRLEKVTYKDENVLSLLGKTIAVKYDAEKGVGETLAHKYRVVAYPTLVVLDSSGEEVDRHIGYLDPEEFVAKIEGYMNGVGTRAFYEQKLRENPDDIETLFTLGMKYCDAVRTVEARRTLGRVLDLDPRDERGRRAEIYYALGDVSYSAEEYAEAKGYFERLAKEFEDTDWCENGLRRLAYVEHKLGNSEEAVATYQRLVAEKPDDPGTLNGFAWFCAQRSIGLDPALTAALKASELSGRDPGILDTLAEVHYARGEYDEAIRVGKEALEKEPDDSYFKEQLEKFEKAKREAEAQTRR